MDEAQANAVFDVLVTHAGASELTRDEFVYHQTHGRCDEFRFIGALGFGGKFWQRDWRVSAYPEDVKRDPSKQQVVNETNAALAELRERIGG